MGWSYYHKEPGSLEQHFREEWGDGVLAVSSKGFRTAYVAYRTKEGKVLCIVVLMHFVREYYNFGRKEVEEGMGPCESDCPKRILDLLSPVDELYEPGSDSHKWATAWRERCYKNLEEQKARVKLSAGKEYEMTGKLRFGSGLVLVPGDVIKCVNPRRLIFDFKWGRLKFDRDSIRYLKVAGPKPMTAGVV